jgi:hypothetical protein
MNPRRLGTVAAWLCARVVLAGWIVAWLAGLGSASVENTGAPPILDRRGPSAELADARQATGMGNPGVATAAERVNGSRCLLSNLSAVAYGYTPSREFRLRIQE